jgi:hypothetical protein
MPTGNETRMDTELHPDLAPLEFLVGMWRGIGVGGYPTIDSFQYAEQLTISHDGRPFLVHSSRTWILDEAGEPVRPSHVEDGYWRPGADGEVELVLTHATGFVEIWLGEVSGPTVTLATDLVARTATAKEVTAGRRLYGVVDDELLTSYDMAAVGQAMQPHLSARLQPIDAAS